MSRTGLERDIDAAIGLLSTSQVAVWATIFLSVFLGPLAIEEITGSFALGGIPFAMYYLSNLLVVVLAGRFMNRIGRAPVLAIGHGAGAAGAASVAPRGLVRRGEMRPSAEARRSVWIY